MISKYTSRSEGVDETSFPPQIDKRDGPKEIVTGLIYNKVVVLLLGSRGKFFYQRWRILCPVTPG